LHYTTGVLSTDDRDLYEDFPNYLHLDPAAPTNVEFGDKRHLVAPTKLRISERHAAATRAAAQRVIHFNEEELKALAANEEQLP
jgi:hypothetical protein